MTALPGVATVKTGYSRGSMDTRPPLQNRLIQKDHNRKTQSYKVESFSGGANMDMQNFSLESKRETEYVSEPGGNDISQTSVILLASLENCNDRNA